MTECSSATKEGVRGVLFHRLLNLVREVRDVRVTLIRRSVRVRTKRTDRIKKDVFGVISENGCERGVRKRQGTDWDQRRGTPGCTTRT